jgi:hypothetical protein
VPIFFNFLTFPVSCVLYRYVIGYNGHVQRLATIISALSVFRQSAILNLSSLTHTLTPRLQKENEPSAEKVITRCLVTATELNEYGVIAEL